MNARALGMGAMLVIATPAAAQEETNAAEIVVTATRSERRLEDVPAAITVQDVDALRVTTLGRLTPALLRNVSTGCPEPAFKPKNVSHTAAGGWTCVRLVLPCSLVISMINPENGCCAFAARDTFGGL